MPSGGLHLLTIPTNYYFHLLQKKELVELDDELQSRVKSVASHRVKIERLQAQLDLLGTQDLGLKHALASDLSPGVLKGNLMNNNISSRLADWRSLQRRVSDLDALDGRLQLSK